MKRFSKIKYIRRHRRAFRALQKHLLGYNTLSAFRHDLDKIILIGLCLPLTTVKRLHRKISSHHVESLVYTNTLDMFIDCECARFTKSDKALNAVDTAKSYYPHLVEEFEKLANYYEKELNSFKGERNE